MEVEELSPPARCHFSLIAPRGASEEDDGFVDILESDLKVTSLAPPGHPPPKACETMTSFQFQKRNRS